jgi:hypothetical protein
MSKHVHHLLTAYAHRQLSRAQRNQVASHVQRCSECRAALDREQELVRDIAVYMPQIGRARRGQLARLWPAIWLEFNTPSFRWATRLSSYGLAVVVLVLFIFVASVLFTYPAQADAASLRIVPADVKATFTPVAMIGSPTAVDEPALSETASVFKIPMASPIPMAGYLMTSQIRYAPGQ